MECQLHEGQVVDMERKGKTVSIKKKPKEAIKESSAKLFSICLCSM
jgi:hypothetical protein